MNTMVYHTIASRWESTARFIHYMHCIIRCTSNFWEN